MLAGNGTYTLLLLRWLRSSKEKDSTDPMWHKYPGLSPYAYCANNPVMLVDPDGRKIRIAGNRTKAVFRQLNSATSLELSIKNGIVSAKGTAKTDADKMLLAAIQDDNVVVNIDATTSNYTKEGNWFIGGAYGGSETDADGKVQTKQTINPDMAKIIDDFYDIGDGVTTMHEVLESYIGGTENPGVGVTTYGNESSVEFKAYKNAHDKAKATGPRYKDIDVSIDAKTRQLYINKGSEEKIINNRE